MSSGSRDDHHNPTDGKGSYKTREVTAGALDTPAPQAVYPDSAVANQRTVLRCHAPEIVTSFKGVRYLSLWGPDLK